MKRAVILTSALLLSSCTQSEPIALDGEVISCESVTRDVNVNNGISVECVDGSAGTVLQSLRGPMVINIWGSWCTTCLAETPKFVSFYSKAKDKIQLIGIAVEERTPEDSQKFIIKHGMTWPNFYDRENKSRGYFGMGVPVTWFIDSDGKVQHKKIGEVTSEQELIDLTAKYLGVAI